MKTPPLLLALTFALASDVLAQPVVSPDVHPEGRVTFRLLAPDARVVSVRCEGVKNGAMEKDARGLWSVTTEPLPPDIYVYSFSVDGVRVLDPGNPVLKYNLFNTENQVHVPGPATLPWEINNVPHGVIHRHLYKSATIGDECPFLVYTPPGYDPAAPQPYPVLYLLHGYSDAEDTWTTVGRADVILDNLIARGLARPMVVVMPRGYGNTRVITGGWAGVRAPAVWQDSNDKFRDALLDEVIPMVEKAYHVSSDRTGRAIAGLSMGATQSLYIGLNAPDRFAWIGAFGAGGLNTDFAAAYPVVGTATNAQLRLLWLACGEQDELLGLNQQLDAWLTERGVRHLWTQIPGQHSFRTWRPLLIKFASLLFRE